MINQSPSTVKGDQFLTLITYYFVSAFYAQSSRNWLAARKSQGHISPLFTQLEWGIAVDPPLIHLFFSFYSM